MASNLITASNGRSSWGGLEVSQKALTFIPYRGYHINIYASDSRDGDPIKYFGSPLVLLNPKSAKYSFNKIRERHQVSFDVDMWNQDVEDFVVEHLNQLPNRPKTDKNHVQGIPFEEVILCSNVISSMYELPSEWTPYQLDTKVTFTLYCPSEEKGRELAELLKSDQDFQTQFASCFRVNLSVTARESRQRDVKIKIENITSGKLCSELDQRFPNADQVLLTAQDTKTILSESVNNVLVDSFTDMKEVADPAAKNRIYSILQTMLVSAQEKIDSDSSKTWDSVFWRDENTRPDKVAKTLNEAYNKSDKETKDKMKDAFSESMSSNMNASLNAEASARILFLASANVKVKGQSSSNNSTSSSSMTDKESYDREMKEIADKVEWNGEKFVPKSMYLTRMNLSTIRNKQAFQDKEIAVSYSMAFLDLKMNVPKEDDVEFSYNSQTPYDSVSTIVIQEAMESKIVALQQQIEDDSVSTIVIQEAMESKIVALQQQIEELRADLATTFAQMKATEKKMSTLSNSSTKPTVVIFDAYRNTTYAALNTIITYNGLNVNEGNAMNPNTGIFTAPFNGIYTFSFYAITDLNGSRDHVKVRLQLNGKWKAQVHGEKTHTHTLAMSTILELKAKDQVSCSLQTGGHIFDTPESTITHFTGHLLALK